MPQYSVDNEFLIARLRAQVWYGGGERGDSGPVTASKAGPGNALPAPALDGHLTHSRTSVCNSQSRQTSILVVDECPLTAGELMSLFDSQPEYRMIRWNHDFRHPAQSVHSDAPDITLISVQPGDPRSIKLARRARAVYPATKIVFLAAHSDNDAVSAAVEIGACGFISDSLSSEKLLHVVASVAYGCIAYDSSATAAILRRVSECGTTRVATDTPHWGMASPQEVRARVF